MLCIFSVSHWYICVLQATEEVLRDYLKGKSWVDFYAVKDSTRDFFLELHLLLSPESESKVQSSDAFRHLKLLPVNGEPVTDKWRISFPEVDPLERPPTFPSPKVI